MYSTGKDLGLVFQHWIYWWLQLQLQNSREGSRGRLFGLVKVWRHLPVVEAVEPEKQAAVSNILCLRKLCLLGFGWGLCLAVILNSAVMSVPVL